MLDAHQEQREPRRQENDNAGQRGVPEVLGDLDVDFVDQVDGAVLRLERGPRDTQQLPFEEVAGCQQEVGQEEHHDGLARCVGGAHRAPEKVFADVHGRLDDLHGRRSPTSLGSRGRVRRQVQGGHRFLKPADGAVATPEQRGHHLAYLPGRHRHFLHDRHDIIRKVVEAGRAPGGEPNEYDGSGDGPEPYDPGQGTHRPFEHVPGQHAQRDGDEQAGHPLQRNDDGQNSQNEKGHAAEADDALGSGRDGTSGRRAHGAGSSKVDTHRPVPHSTGNVQRPGTARWSGAKWATAIVGFAGLAGRRYPAHTYTFVSGLLSEFQDRTMKEDHEPRKTYPAGDPRAKRHPEVRDLRLLTFECQPAHFPGFISHRRQEATHGTAFAMALPCFWFPPGAPRSSRVV